MIRWAPMIARLGILFPSRIVEGKQAFVRSRVEEGDTYKCVFLRLCRNRRHGANFSLRSSRCRYALCVRLSPTRLTLVIIAYILTERCTMGVSKRMRAARVRLSASRCASKKTTSKERSDRTCQTTMVSGTTTVFCRELMASRYFGHSAKMPAPRMLATMRPFSTGHR